MSGQTKYNWTVFALILSFLFIGIAQPAEPIRYGVPAMTLNIAPFILAKELGYYRQEGYDVEIIRARAESLVSAMVSNLMKRIYRDHRANLTEQPWMSTESQRKSLSDADKTIPGVIRKVRHLRLQDDSKRGQGSAQ